MQRRQPSDFTPRRGETPDERRDRMRAKADWLRSFAELDAQAVEAAQRPPKPAPRPPKVARTPRPREARERRRPLRKGARRGPTGRPVTRPSECLGCGRPLCSRENRIEGAVVHAGRGLCSRCDALARRPVRLADRRKLLPSTPPSCVECGIGLRSKHAAVTPDTRRHAGRGKCSACYRGAQRSAAA